MCFELMTAPFLSQGNNSTLLWKYSRILTRTRLLKKRERERECVFFLEKESEPLQPACAVTTGPLWMDLPSLPPRAAEFHSQDG